MKLGRGSRVSDDAVEGSAATHRARVAGLLVTGAIVAAVAVIFVRLLGGVLLGWD